MLFKFKKRKPKSDKKKIFGDKRERCNELYLHKTSANKTLMLEELLEGTTKT